MIRLLALTVFLVCGAPSLLCGMDFSLETGKYRLLLNGSVSINETVEVRVKETNQILTLTPERYEKLMAILAAALEEKVTGPGFRINVYEHPFSIEHSETFSGDYTNTPERRAKLREWTHNLMNCDGDVYNVPDPDMPPIPREWWVAWWAGTVTGNYVFGE